MVVALSVTSGGSRCIENDCQ